MKPETVGDCRTYIKHKGISMVLLTFAEKCLKYYTNVRSNVGL